MAVITSSQHPAFWVVFSSLITAFLLASSVHANDDRKVHIVYMGAPSPSLKGYAAAEAFHLKLLGQVLEGSSPKESLVYTYKTFSGFAARLTTKEKEKLAGYGGIVSVFPGRILKTRTTRSWDFLNFPRFVKRNPTQESDVIVGMLDTGVWPESASFSDNGLGPPPKKWNGACVDFVCNNKIIGARYYNSMNDTNHESSPRDHEGHGSHTASTVAGRSVGSVSLYNLAGGTARGAVPSARLAIYKVCWSFGCAEQDILAAFDDAVADGVDIISVSLGSSGAMDYRYDAIAIGSFHAMKNGILTSASGGNSGPLKGTVSNVAPWMLIAAASSIDRHLITRLVTGDRKTIVGASVNTFATDNKFYPFAYYNDWMDCWSLDTTQAQGKIVLCGSQGDGSGPYQAGAKGAVMVGGYIRDTSFTYPLPALVVSKLEGQMLKQYINTTRYPTATILKGEAAFDSTAPLVASFSSRGPNIITPNVMKPDLSAPGVDIIAAWSPDAPLSGYWNDTRSVKYNIISGTSMACPHVSGAAAYVKSFHTNWSPAAIMSALMTTATPMNPSYHAEAEFAYGSGQVNPVMAINPGLVYDAGANNYIQMLCDQGYDDSTVRLISGDNTARCTGRVKGSVTDLNYPSMTLYVSLYQKFAGQFLRTVTNVGDAKSTYKATIKTSSKLSVAVTPSVLTFKRLNEKQSFVVKVSGGPWTVNSLASASITWSDGKHSVRSPIVVYTDYTS